MADDGALSPGQLEFIERIGRYFEQYQLPRIGGRLLGLLTLADRPLGLDDMASTLGVSRASVSTNIRLSVLLGLAELVSLPGDRRDYYRFAGNAWEQGIAVRISSTSELRRIAQQGLATLPPGNSVARTHLEEMVDFCDFMVEDTRGMLARWRARRAASADHRPHDNESRLIADT